MKELKHNNDNMNSGAKLMSIWIAEPNWWKSTEIYKLIIWYGHIVIASSKGSHIYFLFR
jgi:hypothetical protein